MNQTPDPPSAADAAPAGDTWAASDARILIVSSLQSQVNPLQGLLRGAGYTRVSGSQPPASRARTQLPFDLILLHLCLPDLQGFAGIAPWLGDQRLARPPPVMVINTGPGEAWQALQAGACDCLDAPYNALELLMRARHLLDAQHANRTLLATQRDLEQRLRERTAAWRVSESRCQALTSLLTHPTPETPTASSPA